MENKTNYKSSWAIGGMTVVGVGTGLIFVQTSPIMMAACVIIVAGLGLVVSSFLSRR